MLFLNTYSSKRNELSQVALPNLYSELMVQFTLLSATFPKPGRMHAYDRLRDAPFLEFVVDSDLAIEENDIAKFLRLLSVWLQKKYRTTRTQSKTKPHMDSEKNVIDHLTACSQTYRKGFYNKAIDAFRPILRNCRLSDILYRDYRSGSIHEFDFEVDEEFFSKTDIYTSARYYDGDNTAYLELCFPARWIIDLYRSSVDNYERSLLARRKLPLSLWSKICNIEESKYLDDTSIQVGRDLNIRVDH